MERKVVATRWGHSLAGRSCLICCGSNPLSHSEHSSSIGVWDILPSKGATGSCDLCPHRPQGSDVPTPPWASLAQLIVLTHTVSPAGAEPSLEPPRKQASSITNLPCIPGRTLGRLPSLLLCPEIPAPGCPASLDFAQGKFRTGTFRAFRPPGSPKVCSWASCGGQHGGSSTLSAPPSGLRRPLVITKALHVQRQPFHLAGAAAQPAQGKRTVRAVLAPEQA